MAEKVGLNTDFFITLRGDFSSKSRNRKAILTALAVHKMCETKLLGFPKFIKFWEKGKSK